MSGRPPRPNQGNYRGWPKPHGPRNPGQGHPTQGNYRGWPRPHGSRNPGQGHPTPVGQYWTDPPPQPYRSGDPYQNYSAGGPAGPYSQYGPQGRNQAPGIMGHGPPGSEHYQGYPPSSYGQYGSNYQPEPPPVTFPQPPPTFGGSLPAAPLQNSQNQQLEGASTNSQVRTYSNSPVVVLSTMNRNVEYKFLSDSPPFQVMVCFGGQEFKGVAATKKAAKEEAAKLAMAQYYDMHYISSQDKNETKPKSNKKENQEQKKESLDEKVTRGQKKAMKNESAEESHQKNVENLLTALTKLAEAKSEVPELGGLLAETRNDESEPKEALGHRKTRRGKRARKNKEDTEEGNRNENKDDDDLISGENEVGGSAKGGRESRGRRRGSGRRGRDQQNRSEDHGQNEDKDDEDDDDYSEDDGSDTGSVHSVIYQRSMGSGLNLAPNRKGRQFSSTDNISDIGRGRGKRGQRGQGRGRGSHGNMNRNQDKMERECDAIDDLGVEENEIFEFVVKECGGMVKLSNLVRKCQLFPPGADVGKWFKSHRRRFHVFEDDHEVIFVAPYYKDATFCVDYTGVTKKKQCDKENCDHFHICQHYMRGMCRKGANCTKSHSFSDGHNLRHKNKLGLNAFSDIDICNILLNRYPQICPKKFCNRDKRCPYLHICQSFLNTRCKYAKCKRGHSFDTDHNTWIINRIYHMEKWDKGPNSLFRNILSFPRRRRRDSRRDSGASKQDEIDSLAGDLSDMSISDSDSDMEAEPIEASSLPRTISRKDRFTSSEKLHDTEYLHAVEVNLNNDIKSVNQRKKGDRNKGRKKEAKGSDMSEEEAFEAGAKSRKRNDSDKSEEGAPKGGRKDRNRREYGKTEESKMEEKNSEERAKIHLDDADQTSICYNNVAGTCHLMANCRFHHKSFGLPYLWQVNLMEEWKTFSQLENETIEKGFCSQLEVVDSKVSIASTDYKLHICLDREFSAVVYEIASFPVQQAQHVSVRRLSAPSYAERKTNKPQQGDKRKGPTKEDEGQKGTFCTQWRWFFKDDHNQWTRFEKDGMQFTLEKKFVSKQKTYLFSREDYNFKYRISFDDMEQVNLDTRKKRRLLRRPLFVSGDDVRAKKFPEVLSILSTPGTPYHWAPLDMSGADFELVELEKTDEFNKVQDSFFTTLDKTKYEIDLIYRVQNRSLWNGYFMKKKMMNEKAESEGQTVDERNLFHGTDSLETCRKICTNSFDFRISGKNATVYGEGSYFALESEYSNRYTDKTTGSRLMFRAKVLVGKYTKGERSYKRPPEIPGGSHKLYDSCVNDIVNPTIFVIFDTSQCYPEYLIQYHKKGEDRLAGGVYIPPKPNPSSIASASSGTSNTQVTNQPSAPPTMTGLSGGVNNSSAAFSVRSQVPSVVPSTVGVQGYSQGQFHGSPSNDDNIIYRRTSAGGMHAQIDPQYTYRTASGREAPTSSRRSKDEGCSIQ